jgi:hypothetical protein
MQTYDQSLAKLARDHLVDVNLARPLVRNPEGFDWLMKNGGQNAPEVKR